MPPVADDVVLDAAVVEGPCDCGAGWDLDDGGWNALPWILTSSTPTTGSDAAGSSIRRSTIGIMTTAISRRTMALTAVTMRRRSRRRGAEGAACSRVAVAWDMVARLHLIATTWGLNGSATATEARCHDWSVETDLAPVISRGWWSGGDRGRVRRAVPGPVRPSVPGRAVPTATMPPRPCR
jgi:hypothetical protein